MKTINRSNVHSIEILHTIFVFFITTIVAFTVSLARIPEILKCISESCVVLFDENHVSVENKNTSHHFHSDTIFVFIPKVKRLVREIYTKLSTHNNYNTPFTFNCDNKVDS